MSDPSRRARGRYTEETLVGRGSFGMVFRARHAETGEIVAIKKVLEDRRFRNRELQIVQTLDHCNIVTLKECFQSSGERQDEVYTNLVMEYVPETAYHLCRSHFERDETVPILSTKFYSYQLCRALNYIHNVVGICHRDIKPQNLLVDPERHILKLCDFGSAKKLVPGESSVSYICSRFYRAPELIFGSANYDNSIDIWSLGCVVAEFLTGSPLFPGESGVDQLVEIIKKLGTPTREEIRSMNKNYTHHNFPQIEPQAWRSVFPAQTPPEALTFLRDLLVYDPSRRMTALEACAHPFFDSLRDPDLTSPNHHPLPPLFNFSYQELKGQERLASRLIPPHARHHMSSQDCQRLGLV